MKYCPEGTVLPACVMLGILMLSILTGCDRNTELRQYRQPKSTPSSQAASGVQAAPADLPATRQSPKLAPAAGLQWELPAGWHEDAKPKSMRYATILIGEGDSSAELIITRLTGSFGDSASNLSRWRQQVGLEPLAEGSTLPENPRKTPLGDANLLEIVGPERQMSVAILKQDEATWFFKLIGPKAVVAGQSENFKQFLSSLTLR